MRKGYFPTFCRFKSGQISKTTEGFYSLVLISHNAPRGWLAIIELLTELEDVKH